uniref:Uncharacterized protein n=1 Tax=Arundo donax TaxID=35708 RepID=A0A0A8ZLM7_ARUDO
MSDLDVQIPTSFVMDAMRKVPGQPQAILGISLL